MLRARVYWPAVSAVLAIAIVGGPAYAESRNNSTAKNGTESRTITKSSTANDAPLVEVGLVDEVVPSNERAKPLVVAIGVSSALPDAEFPDTPKYLQILGWDLREIAGSAEGFTANGTDSFGPIARATKKVRLDLVVPDAIIIQSRIIQPSPRDVNALSRAVVVALQNSIGMVRRQTPGTPIVVIGPLWGRSEMLSELARAYWSISGVSVSAKGVSFIETYAIRVQTKPDGVSATTDANRAITNELLDAFRNADVA